MSETWKNERPKWCPHLDCIHKILSQNKLCGGKLSKPVPHDNDFNDLRICLKGVLPNNEIFDLQVNKSDLYHFGRIFKVLKELSNEGA